MGEMLWHFSSHSPESHPKLIPENGLSLREERWVEIFLGRKRAELALELPWPGLQRGHLEYPPGYGQGQHVPGPALAQNQAQAGNSHGLLQGELGSKGISLVQTLRELSLLSVLHERIL